MALLDTGAIPAAERLRAKFPPGLIAITRHPRPGPEARAAAARAARHRLAAGAARGGAGAAAARGARARREVRGESARLAGADWPREGLPIDGYAATPAAGAAAGGDRAGRGARRGPARARPTGRARAARRLGAARGGQRQGHRPRGGHRATPERLAAALASLEQIERVSSAGTAGARGAHALRPERRPADRRPGAARQPAAALHGLRGPQRRAARARRCAEGCTSRSTASGRRDRRPRGRARPRPRCTSCSASPTSSRSCARTAAS